MGPGLAECAPLLPSHPGTFNHTLHFPFLSPSQAQRSLADASERAASDRGDGQRAVLRLRDEVAYEEGRRWRDKLAATELVSGARAQHASVEMYNKHVWRDKLAATELVSAVVVCMHADRIWNLIQVWTQKSRYESTPMPARIIDLPAPPLTLISSYLTPFNPALFSTDSLIHPPPPSTRPLQELKTANGRIEKLQQELAAARQRLNWTPEVGCEGQGEGGTEDGQSSWQCGSVSSAGIQ